MARAWRRLALGVVLNAAAVLILLVVLRFIPVTEFVRWNVAIAALIVSVVLAFVWVPLVVGPTISANLVGVLDPRGDEVVVLRARIRAMDQHEAAIERRHRVARVSLTRAALTVEWAYEDSTPLRWTDVKNVTSKRATLVHLSVNVVVITLTQGQLQFVPFSDGKPLDGASFKTYLDELRELADTYAGARVMQEVNLTKPQWLPMVVVSVTGGAVAGLIFAYFVEFADALRVHSENPNFTNPWLFVVFYGVFGLVYGTAAGAAVATLSCGLGIASHALFGHKWTTLFAIWLGCFVGVSATFLVFYGADRGSNGPLFVLVWGVLASVSLGIVAFPPAPIRRKFGVPWR